MTRDKKEKTANRIDFWNWSDEEIEALDLEIKREHGKVVRKVWEAYFDVYIYEDGYEERISIGD